MKTSTYDINAHVAELAQRAKLDSWNSFVRELPVPNELTLALMTARPELLRLVKPRDYTATEVEAMLKLVAGLMETNAALREHAQQVAHLVDNWASAFQTLHTVGTKVQRFANFQHDQIEESDQA